MNLVRYISLSHIFSLYSNKDVQEICADRVTCVGSFVIRLKSYLNYLTAEVGKKISDYLVVSNNFILSLSLSLSLLYI